MQNRVEIIAGDIRYYVDNNGRIQGTFRNVSVTVKIILKQPLLKNSDIEAITDHIHPNIQRLFSYHASPLNYVLAFDLCTENLKDYIASKKKKSKIISMLQGVTEGLNYLHNKDILHRNLNPKNILVDHARGCAKISNILIRGEKQEQDYMSAELLEDPQAYSERSDIFSLGCIFHFALSNGVHPYCSTFKNIAQNIREGSFYVADLKNIEVGFKKFCIIDLMKQMLMKSHKKRPVCDYVLNHVAFWNTYKIFKLVRLCNLPENRLKYFCGKDYTEIIKSDWRKEIDETIIEKYDTAETKDIGFQGAIKFMALSVQYYEDEYERIFFYEHVKFWLAKFPKLLNYIFATIIRPSSKIRKYFDSLILPVQKCKHFYEEGGLDELFIKHDIDFKWKINRDEVEFEPIEKNIIDMGLTEVYNGIYDSKPVAIKKLNKEDKKKLTRMIDNPREIKNLVKLLSTKSERARKGKNCIVEFYGCFEDENYPENYFLVFEKAECNLLKYFYDKTVFTKYVNEISEQQILRDIAEGVHHIHQCKIVNFDIKFENILLTRRDGVLQACICDFGHSHEEDNEGSVAYSSDVNGTQQHRAPEVIQANNLNEGSLTNKVDIYQLGKIFAYVIIDELRRNEPDRPVNLRSLAAYAKNKKITPLQKDLIQKMIDRDPEERPTADGVRKHPYFWSSEEKYDLLVEIDKKNRPMLESDLHDIIEKAKATVFEYTDWRKFKDVEEETRKRYYNVLDEYKNVVSELEENNIFDFIKFIIYQVENGSSVRLEHWLDAFGEFLPFCYHEMKKFLTANTNLYSMTTQARKIAKKRRPTVDIK